MLTLINETIAGSKGRAITLDARYDNLAGRLPVVVFCHGFKGFKDWGYFNYLSERFAGEGFLFVKFNFSHNGTTPANLLSTDDFEAFGNNNYIIELNDLEKILDWIGNDFPDRKAIDTKGISLIGHSRGGGIAILKAAEDSRIRKLVTWASVSDLLNRASAETIERWKREGVTYTTNARTGQKLPLYYQFHETILANEDRLNIRLACRKLGIPFLIIHGDKDDAVPVREAGELKQWSGGVESGSLLSESPIAGGHLSRKTSELMIVNGAGHTFGVSHPFTPPLPSDAGAVIERTIRFLKDT
jgi:uncharacterized protein